MREMTVGAPQSWGEAGRCAEISVELVARPFCKHVAGVHIDTHGCAGDVTDVVAGMAGVGGLLVERRMPIAYRLVREDCRECAIDRHANVSKFESKSEMDLVRLGLRVGLGVGRAVLLLLLSTLIKT